MAPQAGSETCAGMITSRLHHVCRLRAADPQGLQELPSFAWTCTHAGTCGPPAMESRGQNLFSHHERRTGQQKSDLIAPQKDTAMVFRQQYPLTRPGKGHRWKQYKTHKTRRVVPPRVSATTIFEWVLLFSGSLGPPASEPMNGVGSGASKWFDSNDD